jgi:hypothetical protein
VNFDEAMAAALAAYRDRPITVIEAEEAVFEGGQTNAQLADEMMALEPGLKRGAAMRRAQRYRAALAAAQGRAAPAQRRNPSKQSAATLRQVAVRRVFAPARDAEIRQHGITINFVGQIRYVGDRSNEPASGRTRRAPVPLSPSRSRDPLAASLTESPDAGDLWQRAFMDSYGIADHGGTFEIVNVDRIWLSQGHE